MVLLLVLVVVFAWTAPAFRSPAAVLDQSRYWLEIGILATAMFGVIIARGIDLSVASILALCGVSMVRLHVEGGVPMSLAAAIGLLIGTLAGSLNGIAAAIFRIPDFVVTLATLVIFRGLAQLVAQSRVLSGLPAGYCWLGDGTLFGFLPVQWVLLLAVWSFGWLLFHRSRLGRYAYAMGAAPDAARVAGVPVRATRVLLYAFSGFAAALGAIVYTARFNSARSDDAEGLELEVITCVLLGGTSISGGRGTIWGTMLGVLVVGVVRTGLIFSDVEELYRKIAVGSILVLAAAWNELVVARNMGRAPP